VKTSKVHYSVHSGRALPPSCLQMAQATQAGAVQPINLSATSYGVTRRSKKLRSDPALALFAKLTKVDTAAYNENTAVDALQACSRGIAGRTVCQLCKQTVCGESAQSKLEEQCWSCCKVIQFQIRRLTFRVGQPHGYASKTFEY